MRVVFLLRGGVLVSQVLVQELAVLFKGFLQNLY